jgi:hypothetical protein
MMAAAHWDGHLQNQKGCTEVQQVGGKFFKVDSCNGKVDEIPVTKTSEVQGVPAPARGNSNQTTDDPNKSHPATSQPKSLPSGG